MKFRQAGNGMIIIIDFRVPKIEIRVKLIAINPV